MANEQKSSVPTEVPLEDLDKLLSAEDPEFSKELEAVRSVKTDPNLIIETAVVVDSLYFEGKDSDQSSKGLKKYVKRLQTWVGSLRIRIQAGLIQLFWQTIQFFKTRPIELFFYMLVMSKIIAKKAVAPIKWFQQASTAQKIMVITLFLIVFGSMWIVSANIKGIWLPQLNAPILRSLELQADWVETISSSDRQQRFYAAFPQELHLFLFKKFKVNLSSSVDSPNPMGAFEVIVEVDSKDTAIEVGDRQVELHDLMQRIFEQETANDLSTEFGKNRLKSLFKQELNTKLTQGWVKEVQFKTFILKP